MKCLQPTQEPTHEAFDSAAPSPAEDVESVVPTVAEEANSVVPTTTTDDDGDNSKVTIKDFDISDGALDGIMSPEDPLHKMGNILANVYNAHLGKASASPIASIPESIIHDDGTISIDAIASGTGPHLKAMIEELELVGFKVSATFLHVASGTIPIESLGEMCSCGTLVQAMPALSIAEKGSVTSEGVQAMGVDDVLENLGVDGAGITVGVLSDSYNARGGAASDIATGDLPPAARIKVLNDTITNGSDEGRAMSGFLVHRAFIAINCCKESTHMVTCLLHHFSANHSRCSTRI